MPGRKSWGAVVEENGIDPVSERRFLLMRPTSPSSLLSAVRGLLVLCASLGLGLPAVSALTDPVRGTAVGAAVNHSARGPHGGRVWSAASPGANSRGPISFSLWSTALHDGLTLRSRERRANCYGFGRRTRSQLQKAVTPAVAPQEQRAQDLLEMCPDGPGAQAVTRMLAHELAKVERTPTVTESEVQVVTRGRPDGEVIAVQLMPGGTEISFAPFIEGFREPEGSLGRSGGRLLEGTVGLQLVTGGSWQWRVQMSRIFRNTVVNSVVGSELGFVLLRRF
ncbi:MAG: hypothetical protein ACI9EF_003073 [Pseudohongiellaceae bacterium]